MKFSDQSWRFWGQLNEVDAEKSFKIIMMQMFSRLIECFRTTI